MNQVGADRKTKQHREAKEMKHNTEKRTKQSRKLTSSPRMRQWLLLTQSKPREGQWLLEETTHQPAVLSPRKAHNLYKW